VPGRPWRLDVALHGRSADRLWSVVAVDEGLVRGDPSAGLALAKRHHRVAKLMPVQQCDTVPSLCPIQGVSAWSDRVWPDVSMSPWVPGLTLSVGQCKLV